MVEMSLAIEHVPTLTEDACALIEELEAELSADYPAQQRHGLAVEAVFQPHIAFFVAQFDGEPVGCGGVAFENGWAEVKRMYVRPSARGRGVAKAILARLEDEARHRGVMRMVLETGDVLHAAIRLYQSAGFRPCGSFGAYSAMPANSVARSRFFEKSLA